MIKEQIEVLLKKFATCNEIDGEGMFKAQYNWFKHSN